ncbi:MAG: efflux RND transporter periplasmic adaptor subunit [Muribaculaceae bacterium]|nr:efflux RND transporter periplasmic adaptor subunit [Muribaculaceae bacterium]
MTTARFLSFGMLVSCALCSCQDKKETADSTAPEIDVEQAYTDSIVIHKTYPGLLTANMTVDLVARVNGYLRSMNYKSGDFVKKGSVLFTIEDDSYRDALTKAEGDVATAKSNLEYAETRYKAMEEALKGDAVSKMEVEEAKNTLEECRATLSSAIAAQQTAATQLSYCTITAPFDGHVTTNAYSVGTYVGGEGGAVTLATIYDDHTVTANFSIDDASNLGKLKKNMDSGTIDFNNMPVSFSEPLNHKYTGKLSYMAPQVDITTGTMKLQAVIDNPYGELKPGMYVEVDLPVEDDPHAVIVRDASIATDQLGKYLYVVNDSDKVVYTPITTGELVRDSLRIVTKGINPGERYVSKALLKVRDGMTVKPIE